MTTRMYLFIGLGMAGLIFLIGMVFGDDIAIWAVQQKVEAAIRGQSLFEFLVFEPVRFVFNAETRIIGAVVVFFFWPLVFVMVVLVLLGLVIMSGIDTSRRIESATGFILPLLFR